MNSPARIFGSILCAGPAILFAGCAGAAARTSEVRVVERGSPRLSADPDWRRVATAADRSRLRGWRQAWIAALAKVKGSADAGTLSTDALLFDPDRALEHATPPPGAYRCRIVKLGANGTAMRDVTAYPPVDCHIADNDGVLSLYKTSGPQRPVGLLFPESTSRVVFLGTMVIGDETRPLTYGQDGTRDMAGYVERIDEQRWRLVLPYPRFESMLDVIEIVPAQPPTP